MKPVSPLVAMMLRPAAMAADGLKLIAWQPVAKAKDAKVARGFAPRFLKWLQRKGFGDAAFAQPDRPAYGGQTAKGQPVVLIHGNSDSAEGWAAHIRELEAKGFRPFVFSYGPSDKLKALEQRDTPAFVAEARRFIEAVAAFTGEKVHVVGHSLGTVIMAHALFELKDAGLDLVRKAVDISGVHQGLAMELGSSFNPFIDNAAFDPLRELYRREQREGLPVEHAYAIYGTGDGLLGWDVTRTAPVPHEDARFELPLAGHFEARDKTPELVSTLLGENDVPTDWLERLVS